MVLTAQNVVSPKLKSDYKLKKDHRDKTIAKVIGYDALVEKFYKFILPVEGQIPYVYNDSQGYPTIGSGHLLGFSWSVKFWKQTEVKDVIDKLKLQIEKGKLKGNPKFQKFSDPWDILSYFSIEEKEIEGLFKVECVTDSLLEMLGLPFRISSGTKVLNHGRGSAVAGLSVGIHAGENQVFKTFCSLLQLSLFFFVRQKALGKTSPNPFGGKSFYHPVHNNLILEEKDILRLAYDDIKVKVYELEHQVDSFGKKLKSEDSKAPVALFSSFPLSAQMALLDLRFNGARMPNALLKNAVLQKWSSCLNPEMYGRNVETYKDRNKQVKELFEKAILEKKSEKEIVIKRPNETKDIPYIPTILV